MIMEGGLVYLHNWRDVEAVPVGSKVGVCVKDRDPGAAKLIILNTKFLVFNTQFLVFNTNIHHFKYKIHLLLLTRHASRSDPHGRRSP